MTTIYSEASRFLADRAHSSACPFCNIDLTSEVIFSGQVTDAGEQDLLGYAPHTIDILNYAWCPKCGWSTAHASSSDSSYWGRRILRFGAVSCLKRFDELDVPTDLVWRAVLADFDRRHSIHPRKFEELVAAVMRESGYQVLITSYSGDDGIDIFLYKGSEVIGVQVKRYRHAIEVSQIREFVGSLELADTRKGVFVTTSRFSSGARRHLQAYADRGWSIDLLDATGLRDALNLYHPCDIEFSVEGQIVPLVKELVFVEEWHDW
jgi:hypothetical protein